MGNIACLVILFRCATRALQYMPCMRTYVLLCYYSTVLGVWQAFSFCYRTLALAHLGVNSSIATYLSHIVLVVRFIPELLFFAGGGEDGEEEYNGPPISR